MPGVADGQLLLELDAAIAVQPTPTVCYAGASARADRGRGAPLFAHKHVPALAPGVPDEAKWLAILDLAEHARRYNQAPDPILKLTERGGAGSNGPIGVSDLRLDHSGCAPNPSGRTVVPWPALLRARAEQRRVEPHVARARDLAEAYHYLDYYGSVYEAQPVRGSWRAERLIEQIACTVIELGGEPGLLAAHTAYMRAGIRAAIGAKAARSTHRPRRRRAITATPTQRKERS
jgi:hypothetical protein